MRTRGIRTQGSFSDSFLQNTCKLASSPFGEAGWGFLSKGRGSAYAHTRDKDSGLFL